MDMIIYTIKITNRNMVKHKAAIVIQKAWRKYKKRFVYIDLGDM